MKPCECEWPKPKRHDGKNRNFCTKCRGWIGDERCPEFMAQVARIASGIRTTVGGTRGRMVAK